MKNIALTCVGLVCLSAASGVALFASHTALAASGPKLPAFSMQAHAITANQGARVVPVALTDVALTDDVTPTRSAPVQSDGSDLALAQRVREEVFAPTRALRPQARAGQGVLVAQDFNGGDIGIGGGSGSGRDDFSNETPTAPNNRPAPPPVVEPQVAEPDDVAGAVRLPRPAAAPVTRSTPPSAFVQPVRRTTTSPAPTYLFGVFR